MLHTALAMELESNRRSFHFYVLVAHSGQAVRMILARILFIADPDKCCLHQAHDGCQHLEPRPARQRKILLHAFSYRRQDGTEDGHAVVLSLVTYFAPPGMVSALFSASGVAPGNLQVSFGIQANPYVGPRRRNDQGFYTGQGFFIAYGLAFRIDELKAFATAPAMNARLRVGDITKTRHFCRFRWIGDDFSDCFSFAHGCPN